MAKVIARVQAKRTYHSQCLVMTLWSPMQRDIANRRTWFNWKCGCASLGCETLPPWAGSKWLTHRTSEVTHRTSETVYWIAAGPPHYIVIVHCYILVISTYSAIKGTHARDFHSLFLNFVLHLSVTNK
jgi:hypothetical protein